MGQDKTTARPWAVVPVGLRMQGYGQTQGIIAEMSRDGGQMVAGCFGDVRGGPEQAAANALMIVDRVNGWDALLARAEAAEAERDERQAEAASMAEDLRAAEAEAKRYRDALVPFAHVPCEYRGNIHCSMVPAESGRKMCAPCAARAALRGEGGA